MDPNVVFFVSVFGAILSLGVSGYYYYAAFDQARLRFPAPLQEELAARFAFDTFIWAESVPASARRDYLRSHVYACVAFVSILAVAIERGPPIAALLFGTISLIAVVATLRCWSKYRRRL